VVKSKFLFTFGNINMKNLQILILSVTTVASNAKDGKGI